MRLSPTVQPQNEYPYRGLGYAQYKGSVPKTSVLQQPTQRQRRRSRRPRAWRRAVSSAPAAPASSATARSAPARARADLGALGPGADAGGPRPRRARPRRGRGRTSAPAPVVVVGPAYVEETQREEEMTQVWVPCIVGRKMPTAFGYSVGERFSPVKVLCTT